MLQVKKIYHSLSELPMIIVSGFFLTLSLLNMFYDFSPLDPAWITILISGTPLVILALQRVIKQLFISSALLISIAMFASIFIGEIFAAGEVVFIMAIGAWLEERTTDKAKKGIEALLKLVPNQGRKIIVNDDGTVIQKIVDAKDLKIGDIIRILPGENITADGFIVNGETTVDQSIMTGESLPIDKVKGDNVFSGTLNCFGSIDVKIAKEFNDSSLQKMIALVKDAENKKAPMQKIVDKWAQWLVPIACLIAVIAYITTKDIVRAVTILIVFCPCALALATPTCIVAAIGQATKFGVLIKSGEALEKMGKVTTIAFDKTGTLTIGNLQVTDVTALNINKEKLLALAASCESKSEHPLGKAIVSYVNSLGITYEDSESFTMTVGKGVMARVKEENIICGNEKMLSDYSVPYDNKTLDVVNSYRDQGKAIIIVAGTHSVLGVIALSDELKADSRQAIAELKNAGISKTVLLTGDNPKTANYIANQVGITNIAASLLPENKVEEINKLKDNGDNVCMVGDGVNDAPALKTATVSVAMGTMGSDIAIEASDIALMGDDIKKISYIKKLSNATIRSIKFNITASMVINAVAITMSFLGWLTPITGAIVHNAGSVLVVLNAAKLYDKKIK